MNDNEMNERIANWLDSLSDAERLQVEVLDAYFTFRRNLPGEEPGLGIPMSEPKTTEDILDDLHPMTDLSKAVVVGYMRVHDYGMTTLRDGSVRWAIWRFVDGPC